MKIRILLLPLAWIYGLILRLRHFLYDHGILASASNFGVPVICIGNLNLGGTGKTPFTEYLIRHLSNTYQIGVISRGYGRKSNGFYLANASSTPEQLGDEPTQLYFKFRNQIHLAVCEDRTTGVLKLLELKPTISLIILDDAFQHRKISADINILLSPYHHPFQKDHLLPAGNLRDIKFAAKRADIVIYTKSPKNKTIASLGLTNPERFWISEMIYDEFVSGLSEKPANCPENVLVVAGIAKPNYLINHIESVATKCESLLFPDHHNYSTADILKIVHIFDTFAPDKKAILTTEKDWVKLSKLVGDEANRSKWLIAPIHFQLNEEDKFLKRIETALLHANAKK